MRLIANATERAVRLELWTSFRSLVEAYLAAASIGNEVPLAMVCVTAEAGLQIVGALHTVHLELEPATGEGYWAVHGVGNDGARPALQVEGAAEGLLDEGSFRLHLDAQLEWSGKPGLLAMDQVAEALAMLVL